MLFTEKTVACKSSWFLGHEAPPVTDQRRKHALHPGGKGRSRRVGRQECLVSNAWVPDVATKDLIAGVSDSTDLQAQTDEVRE